MVSVVGVSNTFNGTSGEIIDVKEKSKNTFASPLTNSLEPESCISPLVESTP